jgi:heptaprenyl diphosphate synthase component 2
MVTLPLNYALAEQPRNGHYQEVQNLLNGATQNEEDIQTIVNWVVTGTGVQRSLSDAHLYANKAREALTYFSPSNDRQILDEVIDFVVRRKR